MPNKKGAPVKPVKKGKEEEVKKIDEVEETENEESDEYKEDSDFDPESFSDDFGGDEYNDSESY